MKNGDEASPSIILAAQALLVKMLCLLKILNTIYFTSITQKAQRTNIRVLKGVVVNVFVIIRGGGNRVILEKPE